LSISAGRSEIDKAYKRLSARYAPRLDPRTVEDPNLRADAEQSFLLRNEKALELNEAYEILTDPDRRAEYDRLIDGRVVGSRLRLVADPPLLYFGEVGPGENPVRDLWLVTEPAGQGIPANLRIAAPPWIEVQADALGWGGQPPVGSLHVRVRLVSGRMPSTSVIPGQIAFTWSGQRLDVGAVAVFRGQQNAGRSAHQASDREYRPAQATRQQPESGRAPSAFRLFLLELLGLATALGIFLLLQSSLKLAILGLSLMISSLCLGVETKAFAGIDRRPWYVKSLTGILLASSLPLAILFAIAL